MDLDKVKSFINLAKDEGVTELKYESDGTKISVSFQQNVVASAVAQAPSISQSPIAAASTGPAVQASDDGLKIITSPFVGTFYSSPAPGKPAYVKVGDKVSPGQTLCILEAMKIMNELESEVTGEIVEICTENESLVEFGQALYKIRES